MTKRLFLLALFPLLVFSCKKDKEKTAIQLSILEEPMIETSTKSPLTALLRFQTNHPSKLSIQINGTGALSHQFPEKQEEHEHIILGLYPDTNNEVFLQITDDFENTILDTIYIQTQPIPSFFPEITINICNKNLVEPAWTFCDYSSGKNSHLETFPFIFDDNGTVRWYFNLSDKGNFVNPISRLKNGNVLYAFQDHVFEDDMFGRNINDWYIQGFKQHHDIFEKEDGNLLVAVNNEALSTIEDHVIELDRNSGSIIKTWDLREVLDLTRTVSSGSSVDWFHMNSVWHDPTDNSLILSGKNQGVVKVSYENELQWIIAPHKEWGKAGVDGDGIETSDFLLTAIDDANLAYTEAIQLGDENTAGFDWGWGQHAAMKLKNENILLFDNGNRRLHDTSPLLYSRMVEYQIDTDNMTIQQVTSFGESYGEDLYARILSDVDEQIETGNRMLTAGIVWNNGNSYSKIIELRSGSDEIVFDANINFTNIDNTNEFLWHHFDLLYRAEREQLYKQ